MDTSTLQTRLKNSSTTGSGNGKPTQIGMLVGELGSETQTSFNENRQAALATEQQSQQQYTVVNRFYTALKAIYGSKFDMQFNTPAEVRQSKAMWCEDIEPLPESRLMACLRNAKREMKSGNPDYQWPNIGLILGFNGGDWERSAHRRDFTGTAALEDKTAKERKLEERKAQLAKLREECGL